MITTERKRAMEEEAERWELDASRKRAEGDNCGASMASDQARSVRAAIRQLESPRPAVRFG